MAWNISITLLCLMTFTLGGSQPEKTGVSEYVAPDHVTLKDGGVSGDFLEHWNMYPLTKTVTLRDAPVQCVHVALRQYGNIQITWLNPATFSPNSLKFEPKCWFGESAAVFPHVALGMAYSYPSGMFTHTLNTAVLDLNILTSAYNIMYYKCGDDNFGWSDVYSFQLEKSSVVNTVSYEQNSRSVSNRKKELAVEMEEVQTKSMALIGDLGVTHGLDTMAAIQEFVQSGLVRAVVHAGDISYADNFSKNKHNNSYIWVEYMNEISVFTPSVPYMTAPGNHEAQYNFEPYRNWLPMPSKQSESLSPYWFSFDYMGVHFLSFSTEHSFNQTSEQYKFMEQDLIKANANRQNVPWIVAQGHRPLYCTALASETQRCTDEAPRYRSYIEDLFYEQKVDIYTCGHNHNYERTFPVYKQITIQRNFTNPKAPVYIVNGEAGNPEPNTPSFEPHVDWRANFFPSTDNGFLLMSPSQTSLDFQFIRSKDRAVMDRFTLTKG